MGIVAFIVVYKVIPAGLSHIRPHFWRTFDWAGVFLLAGALAAFLFYLSSRPITGVEPLLDWRLLAMAVDHQLGQTIDARADPFGDLLQHEVTADGLRVWSKGPGPGHEHRIEFELRSQAAAAGR